MIAITAPRGGRRIGSARLLALVALSVVAAAEVIAAAAAQPADRPAVLQEHSVDGVRLALQVDRQELAIDGRIRLSVTLEVPPDRVAALPDLGDQFGRFAVVVQSPAERSSAGGATLFRRYYDLEPEGVGELTVPPLVVAVRARQGGDADAREMRTDPVPVTVASVVPEGVDYTEPKDIAPPMSLPQPGWPAAVWVVLGMVAAAGAAAALWWRRRRPRAAAIQRQPAHLIALAELDRLQQTELGDEDRVETIYVRLSAILRRYLGWRFGLRALVQTTEECVADLPGAERALAPYGPVLSALLTSFDLVKFARYRPRRGEVEDALRRVREFIERTGDERVLVEVAPGP
jgi:Domain of unknown function (DUF4381)